jgi:hypothetical protein
MTMTPALAKALELHQPVAINSNASPTEKQGGRKANLVRSSILDDNWPRKVFAFHQLYQMPGGTGPIDVLSEFRAALRRRLRHEENRETDEAMDAGDVADHVDGCLDLIYVALGELLELGLTPEQINLAMQEVHASNLTKADDEGLPIFDEGGKVCKSPNYIKAQIGTVLGLDGGLDNGPSSR